MKKTPVQKIVSGGQTGVDRAALDTARARGLVAGGFCPQGRRAEDGRIPDRYPLRETASQQYAARTRRNVRLGDATLVLSQRPPGGGTARTLREARRQEKPFCHVRLPATEETLAATRRWLDAEAVRTLRMPNKTSGRSAT